MSGQLYQINLDELTTPEKVHPQPQNRRKFLSWLICEIIIQHRFEAVQPCEHGEQQCVKVLRLMYEVSTCLTTVRTWKLRTTCHHITVYGPQHRHTRIVVLQLTLDGFVRKYEEVVLASVYRQCRSHMHFVRRSYVQALSMSFGCHARACSACSSPMLEMPEPCRRDKSILTCGSSIQKLDAGVASVSHVAYKAPIRPDIPSARLTSSLVASGLRS